jgi:hypothetical protein
MAYILLVQVFQECSLASQAQSNEHFTFHFLHFTGSLGGSCVLREEEIPYDVILPSE